MREKQKKIQKKKRENFAEQLRMAVSLFSVTLGMCTGISFILEVDMKRPELLAAGICMVFCLGRIGKAWAIGVSAVSLGAVAAMLWNNRDVLENGVKGLGNTIFRLINEYYGTELLYWYLEEKEKGLPMALFFLLLCLSALEGVLLCATAKRSKRILAALLPAGIIICGLLVGARPGLKEMFWITLGLFLHLCYLDITRNWKVAAAVGSVMLLGAVVLGGDGGRRFLETYHGPWKSAQLKLEDRALEFTQEHLDLDKLLKEIPKTKMNLSNKRPSQERKEIFQITLSQRPQTPMYLKGFVGETYQNGQWKAGKKQEFSDLAQQNGYSAKEYAEVIQRVPYLCTMLSDTKPEDIRIQMKDTLAGYTLIPYFSLMSEDMELTNDGALEPSRQKTYQLSGYTEHADTWNEKFYLEVYPMLGAARNGAERGANAWRQQLDQADWEAYISYVKKHNLDYPKETLPRLSKVAEAIAYEVEESSYDGAMNLEITVSSSDIETEKAEQRYRDNRVIRCKNLVQKRLDLDTQYSLELSDVPEGKEFAEYFLLDQKKGFCVHYATAGTLLLRMLGVPARYVSGYVVMPYDFKKNSDGSYTAVVTDRRAHAWTEVFQEDFGFYPVEMTPPAYVEALDNDINREEDMQSIVSDIYQQKEKERPFAPLAERKNLQAAEKEETQAEQEAKEGDSYDESKDSLEGTALSGDAKKEGTGRLAAGALAGVVLFLMLLVLTVLRRKWYWKKKYTAFGKQNRSQAALTIGRETFKILRTLGLAIPSGMQEQEYGRWLESRFPLENTNGWESFMAILQKARFSGSPLEESGYQELYGMYWSLRKEFLAGKNRFQIYYYRYIHILS